MDTEALSNRLSTLLKSNSQCTKRDVMKVKGIKENPIASIILDKYTNDSALDLKKMLDDFDAFIGKNPLIHKLKFLFDIYDKDQDGLISNYELFNIIDTLCEGNLERKNVQNIVDQTYQNNEVIDFEAFYKIVVSNTKNIETYFMTHK